MLFLKRNKKTHTVRLLPSDYVIDVKPGQTLLQAALEAGLQYPHDCRRGSCGKCKTRLVSGEIKEQTDFTYALDDDELQQGMILACSTLLKSPLTVQVDLESDQRTLGCASCDGTIIRYKLLAPGILEIGVSLNKDLPRSGDSCGPCAPYVAGQFADIQIPGVQEPRSYSFATAKENEKPGEVTFLVRHLPGGEASGWFHSQDRTGENISLSGPYGSFYLHEGDGPILCIAGGSGMSSVKALLEHACNNRVERDAVFLFGARTRDDLFYLDHMEHLRRKWSKKHAFQFIPVLSDESESEDWSGLGGLVTDHIRDLGIDLKSCQAYLSGPPEMIDTAIDELEKDGVSEEDIYSDKFLDSSHVERLRK